MQEEAAIGRPLAGMVSLVARRGALTATRQGGGVGAVHGVRFAVAVLKTSAKYLKPRINLVVQVLVSKEIKVRVKSGSDAASTRDEEWFNDKVKSACGDLQCVWAHAVRPKPPRFRIP